MEAQFIVMNNETLLVFRLKLVHDRQIVIQISVKKKMLNEIFHHESILFDMTLFFMHPYKVQ